MIVFEFPVAGESTAADQGRSGARSAEPFVPIPQHIDRAGDVCGRFVPAASSADSRSAPMETPTSAMGRRTATPPYASRDDDRRP